MSSAHHLHASTWAVAVLWCPAKRITPSYTCAGCAAAVVPELGIDNFNIDPGGLLRHLHTCRTHRPCHPTAMSLGPAAIHERLTVLTTPTHNDWCAQRLDAWLPALMGPPHFHPHASHRSPSTNRVLLVSWLRAYYQLICNAICRDEVAHAHHLAIQAKNAADAFDTHELRKIVTHMTPLMAHHSDAARAQAFVGHFATQQTAA